MEKIISNDSKLALELENNLIRNNYLISKNELLNPNIYQAALETQYIFLMENKEMIAGVKIVFDYYNWIYVDYLWVNADFRKKGLGKKLIDEVKAIGKEKKCFAMRVETWDFQARGFYEKQGFKLYGELKNHPIGITEFYLEAKL